MPTAPALLRFGLGRSGVVINTSVIARLLPTAPALQGWNSREKIS
jgi:hypothetical protein